MKPSNSPLHTHFRTGIILQSFMYKSPNGKYQLRKNVAVSALPIYLIPFIHPHQPLSNPSPESQLTSKIREHWTKALDAFIKADEVEREAEMV